MTQQAIQKKAAGPVDQMVLTIMNDIQTRQTKLEDLLPPDMTPARFTASVGLALAAQPSLMKCDRGSIVLAVMKAAKLGVDVAGGADGHGYLVPYGTDCTFVPGYKGLVALAVTCGLVRAMTPVLVREKDTFEVEEGDSPRVIHRPFIPRKAGENRGEVIAVYTRVRYPDGTDIIKGLMYLPDIFRIEGKSRAKNGPWKSDRDQMIEKSSIKTAFKTLGVPSTDQTARLRGALEADFEAEARAVDEEPTHSLTAEEPITGTAALKQRLKASHERLEQELAAEPTPVSHSMTDPNAVPPDDVELPS